MKKSMMLLSMIILGGLIAPRLEADTFNWNFNNGSEYNYNNETIEIAGGQAQLKAATWWHALWSERLAMAVSNTQSATALKDYQVNINLGILAGMQADGGDIRLVDSNGNTLPLWIQAIDASSVTICAKLYSIPGYNTSTVFIYYNTTFTASSVSSLDDVFSYTTPQNVYYVVAARNYNLNIASYADGNTVTVGGSTYWPQEQEVITIDSGAINGSSPIAVTHPISTRLVGECTEGAIPISWAGKQFTYGGMRGTDVWDIHSPFGIANVAIYNGTSLIYNNAINGAISITQDIIEGQAVIIESDLPILVHHQASNDNDSFNLYPAHRELYGIISTHCFVGILENGTDITVYDSAGGTTSYTGYSRGQEIDISGGGSYGSGNAFRIVSNKPVGALQQADSDGSESSTFLPVDRLTNYYVLPVAADYVAIVCPYNNTTVDVINTSGATVDTATITNGLASDFPRKIHFAQPSGFGAGYKLVGNQPFYVYYEDSSTDDETNLTSAIDSRQYHYPEPFITTAGAYPTTNPTIAAVASSAVAFTTLAGFTETATKPAGTAIRYTVSNDQGSTWYYYNGSWQVANGSYSQTNEASVVNAQLSSLPTGNGQFLFQAFLNSDSFSTPQLDDCQLEYDGGSLEIAEVWSPSDSVYASQTFIPVTVTVHNTSQLGLTITASDLSFTDQSLFFDVTPEPGNPTFINPESTIYLEYFVDVAAQASPGGTTINATISATSAVLDFDLTSTSQPHYWDILDISQGDLVVLAVTSPVSQVYQTDSQQAVTITVSNSTPFDMVINNSGLSFSSGNAYFSVTTTGLDNPAVIQANSITAVSYLVDLDFDTPTGPTVVDAYISATSTAGLSSVSGSVSPLTWTVLGYETGDLVIQSVTSSEATVQRDQANLPVAVQIINQSDFDFIIKSDQLEFNSNAFGFNVMKDNGNPVVLKANTTTALSYLVEVTEVVAPGTYTIQSRLNVTATSRDLVVDTAQSPLVWTVLDFVPGEVFIQSVNSPYQQVAQDQEGVAVTVIIHNTSPVDLSIDDSALLFSHSGSGFVYVPSSDNPRQLASQSSAQLNYKVNISNVVPTGPITLDSQVLVTSDFESTTITAAVQPLLWQVYAPQDAFHQVRPTVCRLAERDRVTIDYELQQEQSISLEIYNMSGELVKTLVDGTPGIGRHQVDWTIDNGEANRQGDLVAAGVYLVVLKTGDYQKVKKVVVVK